MSINVVDWYSHLFKTFLRFVVIHTVKAFSVVNEADVFLEFPCFSCNPTDVAEKAMATHSSTLAWKIPMVRESWGAAVHGVAKS